MELQEPKTIDFAPHYRLLALNDNADWTSVRVNYRRLVHKWHPDKFAQKPRERIHAQQHFIKLTKSYNELRNFYRKHQRLPFQPANTVNAQDRASSCNSAQTDKQVHDDTATMAMDSGLLKREPSKRGRTNSPSGNVKKVVWLMTGACIMVGTIMFFLILDRNANRAVAEKGREIVKEAPQSDFLPSAAEIRRSQSRGAFVDPPR